MAVASSLHQPHSLQFLASGADWSGPNWLALTLGGGWPYDKAVQEILPNAVHQVLQVDVQSTAAIPASSPVLGVGWK